MNSFPFQVIHQKPKKTLNEITKDLCPVSALLPFSLVFKLFQPWLSLLTYFPYVYTLLLRCLAYNSYIGSVQCTGMTNMARIVYLQKYVNLMELVLISSLLAFELPLFRILPILRSLYLKILFILTPFFIVQVISSMRILMTEDSNNAISSFLLDDDSRYNLHSNCHSHLISMVW